MAFLKVWLPPRIIFWWLCKALNTPVINTHLCLPRIIAVKKIWLKECSINDSKYVIGARLWCTGEDLLEAAACQGQNKLNEKWCWFVLRAIDAKPRSILPVSRNWGDFYSVSPGILMIYKALFPPINPVQLRPISVLQCFNLPFSIESVCKVPRQKGNEQSDSFATINKFWQKGKTIV